MTHRAQVSLSLRRSQHTEPCHPTFPDTPRLFRATLTHTDGTVRGKSYKSFTKGGDDKGRRAPGAGGQLSSQEPPRSRLCLLFSPTNARRDTRPPPPVPSASAQPLSPTAPTAELPLTHFPARRAAAPRCPPAPPPAQLSPTRDAAPRPSPAVSPPRPGRTRGLPADTEPSGASHRPTDRPTDGLSRLPAGCPAEPLPGGACPRRACWCCVAAEPWQERGARRWHGPAAGLGSVRPSLSPSRGGGPGSLQAPGTAGRLRWWPGPLTPPSSRPLEEASHGQRGFLPPLARRAAGRRAQMEGGQFPPSPHGWQRGAASRSSAP